MNIKCMVFEGICNKIYFTLLRSRCILTVFKKNSQLYFGIQTQRIQSKFTAVVCSECYFDIQLKIQFIRSLAQYVFQMKCCNVLFGYHARRKSCVRKIRQLGLIHINMIPWWCRGDGFLYICNFNRLSKLCDDVIKKNNIQILRNVCISIHMTKTSQFQPK